MNRHSAEDSPAALRGSSSPPVAPASPADGLAPDVDGATPAERSRFRVLLEGLPLYVRCTEQRGRGLYAARAIPKGTVIFEEVPLMAMQTLPNRADCAVCARCFRFLGSVELQLELLARRQPLQTLSLADVALELPTAPVRDPQQLSEVVRCEWGCGELYCGAACRAAAAPAHQLLCVAQVHNPRQPSFPHHNLNTLQHPPQRNDGHGAPGVQKGGARDARRARSKF